MDTTAISPLLYMQPARRAVINLFADMNNNKMYSQG